MRVKYFDIITIAMFIILFYNSCKKEGEQCIRTKVSGKVTDYYSGNPIANATVKLIKRNNFTSPEENDTISSTQTNTDGEYEIKFHAMAEDYIVYGLAINKEPEGYEDNFSHVIKKKHSNKINYAIKGSAFLKLHIKDVAPFDEHDYISISVWPNFDAIPAFHGLGTNIDTCIVFTSDGSIYFEIGWIVTKNNVHNNFLDSIYCNSLSTVDYYINCKKNVFYGKNCFHLDKIKITHLHDTLLRLDNF